MKQTESLANAIDEFGNKEYLASHGKVAPDHCCHERCQPRFWTAEVQQVCKGYRCRL